MKRLTIIAVLLILVATTAGCRRGTRMWGMRGAPCGAPAYPPPPPVAVTSEPMYDPSVVYSPVTTSSSMPVTTSAPMTMSAPMEVYPSPVPTIESIPQMQ